MSNTAVTFRAIIELGSHEIASAVAKALTPEAEIRLRGVKTRISIVGESVIELIIEAPDYSSFRAAVNAMLRLMSSTLELIKKISSTT